MHHRGHSLIIMCKQTLRHRAVQKCADHTAVQLSGEADHPRLGLEPGGNTTLRVWFTPQVQSVRIRGIADDAARMQ